MADDRATKRYREIYALLLRVYPEGFRRRFAESMEQTFCDLCRERQTTGKGLLTYVLAVYVETSVGVIRERMALLMPHRKNFLRPLLVTVAILLVPLVAMPFSDEVDWSPFDFVVAGVLLFGAGLGFELVARRASDTAYRAATGLAFAAGLLLIWANLAVGFFGSEENPANVLYLGVLGIAVLGGGIARLRPRRMARVMYATAVAQALVPVLALAIWRPLIEGGDGVSGLVRVLLANAFFALLFLGSGILFAVSSEARPAGSTSLDPDFHERG